MLLVRARRAARKETMKPYGLTRKIKRNLPDNHINGEQKRHNLVNWWEVDMKSVIKQRERELGKKEIRFRGIRS
jgi:hypothetical protein